MSECRACRREIEWVIVQETGRRMPLDPNPVDDGNVVKLGVTDAETGAAFVKVLRKNEQPTFPSIAQTVGGIQPTQEVYRSHFSTCPGADEFRKKRK